MNYCIYCDNLLDSEDNEKKDKKNTKELYKCPHCGISFTKLDAERFYKRQDELIHSPVKASEKDSLSAAWKLMQNSEWEQALDRLFEHTCPFKHTLEFVFYRGVCQLGPILMSSDINTIDRRYGVLNSLIDNLSILDSLLPSDAKERYTVLRRISDALLLASSQPLVFFSQIAGDDGDKRYLDKTCKMRSQLYGIYADYLETCANKTFKPEEDLSTDYLLMAYEIMCASWEQAKEPKAAVYLTNLDKSMRLSIRERREIENRIHELEDVLSKNVPNFKPKELSPWPPIVPPWKVFLIVVIVLGVFIGFLMIFRVKH